PHRRGQIGWKPQRVFRRGRNGARRAQRSRARLPRSCLQAGVNPAFSPRRNFGEIGAGIGASFARAIGLLHRNFLRFHALTSGRSGATSRQEKYMNNPNQPKPNQPQQGNPRPGQQQGGGGQKPGQQQQGGGQQKPGQQPGQGGHQGGQQGGMDR